MYKQQQQGHQHTDIKDSAIESGTVFDVSVLVSHAVDGIKNDGGMHITTACDEMTITVEHTIRETVTPETVPSPAFDGADGQRARLQALLNKCAHGFSKDDDDLGYTDTVQHCVRKTNEVPVVQPYRSIPPNQLPPNQLQEVKEHIKGLPAGKIIVESHSLYAVPMVLVRKKDGSLQLCVDYRRLNASTVEDAHQFPRIQESLGTLVGTQSFSTLDLTS